MARWRTTPAQEAPPEPAPPSTEALESLVAGLFDYAGMFPPANLGLEAALAESARLPRLRRPHIVGADMVSSLDDLARIDEAALRTAGFGDTEAKIAVVGVEAAQAVTAAQALARTNQALAGVLRVVSLEVHGTAFPGAQLRNAVQAAPGVQVYIEPRMPDASWSKNSAGLFHLLENLETNDTTVGLKVRGSGPTAIRPSTLGAVIPQVVALGVPFKATAALHHPIVEERYGNATGFVGLAAAIRLRQALGDAFDAGQVVRCLTESQAAAFAFDGELSWHGHAIKLEALREAIRLQPFAIGSCSLQEPDLDLARLFG